MDIISILKQLNPYLVIKNLFKKSADKKSSITGSIVFDIINNKDISIKCYFPEIDNLDDNDMINYAESYGRLLSNINDGLYTEKIADILLKKSEKDNPKILLFVNNIMSFWSTFTIENTKMIIKNSNQPLVRPSRVFKR